VRVEWQLYELDTGELHRCPPKDDSYRTVHVPGWLGALLAAQVVPGSCACHGYRYAFGGYGTANGAVRRSGPKLADVARAAVLSTGTVSNVLNRPHLVEAMVEDLRQNPHAWENPTLERFLEALAASVASDRDWPEYLSWRLLVEALTMASGYE
jgi:hypothetical protein